MPKAVAPKAASLFSGKVPIFRQVDPAERRKQLRNLRDSLPIHEYLAMLNTIALTGRIPIYEPGTSQYAPPKFTNEYTEPDRKIQVEILRDLADRSMQPLIREDKVREAVDAAAALRAISSDPNTADKLSLNELMHLTRQKITEAEVVPDAITEQHNQPAG